MKIAVVLMFSTSTFAQTPGNPEMDTQHSYYYFPIGTSDTGSVGNNQVWDYSNITMDTMALSIIEYRTPSQNELIMEPNANLIATNLYGQINMYLINQDSITNIGFMDEFSGDYIQFDDPNKIFTMPLASNINWNNDLFSCTFNAGSDVKATTKWKISGTGTLITPYSTYQDVNKVSRYSTYEYFLNGVLYGAFNSTEITFFNSNFSKPLINIYSDDETPEGEGFVLIDQQSTASVNDIEQEVVKVFPNPASDHLNFSDNILSVEIRTMEGRVIDQFDGNQPYSLNHLERGNYLFTLRTNTGESTQKVLVM